MDIFLQSGSWIALLTLTFLEIVLGIDNIIFISIVSSKLPENEQKKARNTGLVLALFFRIGLLLGISFIINSTQPLFSLPLVDIDISARDLILMAGGLFLIAKSTSEIHHKIDGKEEEHKQTKAKPVNLKKVVLQIILLDIIFSFDSILTAVGLTDHVILMITAVILSMFVMMFFAAGISAVINRHPTLQMLALSFLILIGFTLIMESLHQHVPKGYIYFSVAFSLLVELLNIRLRKKTMV